MREFASGVLRFGPYLASTAIQAIAQFVALPLLSRRMEPEDFGAVALTAASAIIASIVLSLGLPGAITRAYFYHDSGARLALGIAFYAALIQLALGFVALLFLIVARPGDNGSVLLATAAIGFGLAAHQSVLALLRARRRPWRYLAAMASLMLVPTFGALAAGELFGYSLQSYLVILSSLTIFVMVANLVANATAGLSRLKFRELGWVPAFSLPLVLHSSALVLLASGDRLILAPILGFESVGVYQVGYLVGAIPISVLLAVNNVLAPDLYSTPKNSLTLMVKRQSRQLQYLALSLTVLAAYAAPLAISILVPSSYNRNEILTVALISSLSSLAYASYLSSTHSFFIEGRTSGLARSTPQAVLLSLAFSAIGAVFFGLAGAAAGSLCGYVALAILTGYSRKQTTRRWVPSQQSPALIATAFVAVGAAAILQRIGLPDVSMTIVGACGAAVTLWIGRSENAPNSSMRADVDAT